ncbi:MAG: hypothetical protein AB9869_00045 [Verrucomicrobiia bacterium]
MRRSIDLAQAALQIERWAWWFAREVVQQTNALLRGAKAHELAAREDAPVAP